MPCRNLTSLYYKEYLLVIKKEGVFRTLTTLQNAKQTVKAK